MSKGVALVTGASRGIGRSIAIRLFKDGFKIALNDIPAAQETLISVRDEIENEGGEAIICLADISIEKDVEGMIHETVLKLGGLDVMVANAGICITKPFLESSSEDFDRIFSINVFGTYLCYKYAAEQMIEQGRGGRIIGASSLAGKRGAGLLSLYSSSKFAVRGLTQSTAVELGKYGITVNAYAPGPVDTMMMSDIRKTVGVMQSAPTGTTGALQALAQQPITGRDATPDEIAGLVSYLASKEAGMITGQSVSINGGMYFD